MLFLYDICCNIKYFFGKFKLVCDVYSIRVFIEVYLEIGIASLRRVY